MTQTMIAVIEPARIATDLRVQRRLLGIRLASAIPAAEASDVAALNLCYCRVADLLLRISRVPQAPPGARTEAKGRTLQIEPEAVDTPEIPASAPADMQNQGSDDVLSQDSQS